jgi:WD40 repeat protein
MQTVLLSFLCCVSSFSLAAKDTKPLRVDLAEQQRVSGYSLIDTWGSRGGEVRIVSVEHRTVTETKVKNIQDLTSSECSSRERRYSVFHKNGIWLRDKQSGEAEEIETEGDFSTQCFSPDLKFVYFSGGRIRIYDLKLKKSTDIAKENDRTWPTWSPNGKWLGFDDGKRYALFDLETGKRRKLFKYSSGVYWSPDSRYLTYTAPGGSTGGFLFWGIQCIEPYHVWVWRVEDGAHDWVQQICKPGYSFKWVENSALSDQ